MSNRAWAAPNAPAFFLALCVYRILNALLIQTQFDPDEYWQTLEPAYCQAFASPCAYTWEWTRRHGDTGTGTTSGQFATTLLTLLEQSLHGPVRSFLSVLPTYFLYSVAKYARWDTWWVISKGPMVLHAILAAAPTDYAVYNIAHLVYHDHGGNAQQYARWALLLSASSWFHGYALIRTYSNSVETMLLLVGLTLVAPDLYPGPNHDGKSLRVPCWQAAVAFVLGGMSVAIRFTSLAAWVPLGLLLARKKQSTLYYLIRPCALFGLAGLGIALVVDRYFFGFWVLPVLGSFQFNVVEGHGSLYGTHPWYWYLIAGLPAICGLSLPLVLISIRQSVTGTSTTTTTTTRPLWIIICSYTVLHSCSAHKEFRFLLPILPLLHIVSASAAVSVVQGKRKRLLWLGGVYVVVNLIAVLYLGVLHQAGPVAIQRGLVQHVAMSTSTTSPRTVTVHYWMSCHSTPLYSHLHHQRTATTMMTTTLLLEAWYLDCSPSCRMHPPAGGGCESDAFQSDPRAFVRNKYMRMEGESECQEEGDETCGGLLSQSGMVGWKVHTSIPDYVAILSSDEMTLRNELQMMNLVQVGRYPHTLKGVRIGSLTLGSIESRQEKVLVQVSFEEMVLLRHQLNI